MALKIRNPLRQPLKRTARTMRQWLGDTDPHRQKVFGIGLSRTGTKSLHQALEALGYYSDHFSTHLLTLRDNTLQLKWKEVAHYDALTDVTAAHFFCELDRRYPHSKFILTVREPQKWLRSCERHFPPLARGKWPHGVEKILRLREEVYGTLFFDRDCFLHAYQTHIEAVKRYFRDRPDDLLILNITDGEGWRPICDFLSCAPPARQFPWANSAGSHHKSARNNGKPKRHLLKWSTISNRKSS